MLSSHFHTSHGKGYQVFMNLKTIKSIIRYNHTKFKMKSRGLVTRLPGGTYLLAHYLQTSRNKRFDNSAEVFLVSFPKCGRTWLKLMIGKAIVCHFNLEEADSLDLKGLAERDTRIPQIEVTHDDNPQWKSAAELTTTKSNYKDKKVIFLVRDIRDVVVSIYFQKLKRAGEYHGSLSTFLYHEIGSIDTIITYYNIWAMNRHIPSEFLLVRYEDMQADAPKVLRQVLDFLGIKNVSDKVIAEVVEYTSFDNMRKMESEAQFMNLALRPGDPNDPESFKVRRGKVGGFVDYLEPEEVEYLNQKIKSELSDFYHWYLMEPALTGKFLSRVEEGYKV